MKSLLCYFSGTGNSKAVATDIYHHIAVDTILSVEEVQKEPQLLADVSNLILVFPLYFFGPPVPIRRFTEEVLSVVKPDLEYLAVVYTHGGMPIYGPSICDRLLAEAGYVASYVAGIAMIDTYIPLFRIPNKKRQQHRHSVIAKRIAVVVDDLAEQKLQVATRLPFARLYHTLWNHLCERRPEKDRRFVVTDACSACGICVRICPAHNITLEGGKVQYHHHCEQCFACYHHCPEQAIRISPPPLLGYSWYRPPTAFLDKE
jgi:ferredoxin